MESFVIRVFVHEIETQSAFAFRALHQLRQALNVKDTRAVFFYAQALLGAAAMVSKLLWPSSPKIPDRGKILRELMGIPDESPLADKTMRNHFEHFDDRLDQWATASRRRNFVDSNIAPLSAIRGVDPEDFLRNLDPTSLTLTFRGDTGDTYDLQAVETALSEIYQGALDKRNYGTTP